jgi:predicted dithiol-disulfide oxidoreductase (DUF899 family)
MEKHQVVSGADWIEARKQLLIKEGIYALA